MQILSFLFLFFISFSAHAAGEDIFGELFGRPEMRLQTKFSYGFTGVKEVDLKNSTQELRLRKHTLDGSIPLSSNLMNKWKLLLNGDYTEIKSAARFQNQRPMPNHLMDLGIGFSHSEALDNGSTFAQNLMVGSQSDRPFNSLREVSFSGNLIYKKPSGADNAWLFFMNIANNRGILPYIPIPGFAYFFKARENLRFMVGVPFFSTFWTPFDKTVFTFFYFPSRNASMRLAYFLFGPAHIYLSAKFQSENYLLSDRTDKKERFFYEDGISQLGFVMPLEQNLLLDGSVGYTFSRKYYLAQKTSDRKTTANYLNPQNAGLLHLKLTAVF